MQRDATLSAAEMAGIGKVALMQEPVAAVMSVMRYRDTDGMFLVYDLGGGTFDIALAQSISRRVSLLEHGGIVMCGGRDFDRLIVEQIVSPWLIEQFSLPENFAEQKKYEKLLRLASWASEKAKIELSFRDEAIISLSDFEIGLQDESGNAIYIDIPIERDHLNTLIETTVLKTVEATREVIETASLTSDDIDRIVFIGGPTQYKPLRDLVCDNLRISADTQVDPMTAVAEGAATFAEAIDWSTEKRGRKISRGSLTVDGKLKIGLEYTSRTSDTKSRIMIRCESKILPGTQFQIDNLDTGWSSGRIELKDNFQIVVRLAKNGDNRFKIFVFDQSAGPVTIENSTVVITRTTATIDAIPASHSLGIEVKERFAGTATKLRYLVRKGDPLPQKGTEKFKATEALRANGPGILAFKLWEGEIDSPVTDNEMVGYLKITGMDFDSGVIEAGAELTCDYEVFDSGKMSISVTVPSVSGTFNPGHDFYSRQEGQRNFLNEGKIVHEDNERVLDRIEAFSNKVNDERLDDLREKLIETREMSLKEGDPESIKQAHENVLESKRILAKVRKDHLKEMRQVELDGITAFFQEYVNEYAKDTEITAFNNMRKTAKRGIDTNSSEFENYLEEMKEINWHILWREDWFVVDTFQRLSKEEDLVTDRTMFQELVGAGVDALQRDNIEELRKIVFQIYQIKLTHTSHEDIYLPVNII